MRIQTDERVDFKSFCNFKNFMSDNYQDFDEVFEEQGMIHKKKYNELINEFTTKHDNNITKFQKQALFSILD